jgi:hypothetical protein
MSALLTTPALGTVWEAQAELFGLCRSSERRFWVRSKPRSPPAVASGWAVHAQTGIAPSQRLLRVIRAGSYSRTRVAFL